MHTNPPPSKTPNNLARTDVSFPHHCVSARSLSVVVLNVCCCLKSLECNFVPVFLRQIPLRRPANQADSKASKRYESRNAHRTPNRPRISSGPEELHIGASVFYAGSQVVRDPPKVQGSPGKSAASNLLLLAVKPCSNPIFSFCRLYFMTYFPSGFWSRLIVRILADTSVLSVVQSLFRLPEELLSKSPEVHSMVDRDPEWHCWQSGLELFYMGFEVRVCRVCEGVYGGGGCRVCSVQGGGVQGVCQVCRVCRVCESVPGVLSVWECARCVGCAVQSVWGVQGVGCAGCMRVCRVGGGGAGCVPGV